ncbi:uncharacterized protein LOC117649731 [Thrips palmi]|uniref:Uncharacterized protein LOC117649731 n=1 Tax=Thrips palmi TaxID=161013 RepID=A0A6P8ZTS8_THRPL|nr:uncharacterized protein LOC117649731 [Thrips palmi]
MTVWVIKHSRAVETENKLLQALNKELINPDIKYKYLTYTCKSGGKPRIGSGNGIRVNQSTFKTGCPARIGLKYVKDTKKLVVSEVNLKHSHPVTANIKSCYPEGRRLDKEQSQTVENLLKAKVKPTMIRNLLAGQTSTKVTTRDIANARARMKKAALGGLTEEEKLLDVLQELVDEDPGANIHVGQDKEDNMEFLFFQTSEMKENMAKYPSVTIMDTTYKINKNQMPVVVFMVMDGHGAGRVGGYAFVANELKVTLKKVLECLKQSLGNDTVQKMKVVVVDKDYSEIGALREVFPHCSIQLCDFHVSKTFKKKTSELHEPPVVLEILTKLRYCTNNEKFEELVTEFKAVASDAMIKYFDENWLTISEGWSSRDRHDSLGNTTSNRVENHNGVIKLVLDQDNALWEAIKGLTDLFRNKQEDVMFRDTTESIKRQYIIGNTDPVLGKIVSEFTKFAANYMRDQYKLSEKVEESSIHDHQSTTTYCACVTRLSFRLPCRHIMHLRLKEGLPLYERGEIDPMWLQESVDVPVTQACSPGVVVAHRMPARIVPTNSQQRFTVAMDIAKKLCNVLAECGTSQYAHRHQQLKDLLEMWTKGKEIAILEVVAGSNGTHSVITNGAAQNLGQGDKIEIVIAEDEVVEEQVVQEQVVQEKAAEEQVVVQQTIEDQTMTDTAMMANRTVVQERADCFSSTVQENLNRLTETLPPLCKCRRPTKRLTVVKEGINKGRMFYCCNRPKEQQCGFFQWIGKIKVPRAISHNSVRNESVDLDDITSQQVTKVVTYATVHHNVGNQSVKKNDSSTLWEDNDGNDEMLSLLVDQIDEEESQSSQDQEVQNSNEPDKKNNEEFESDEESIEEIILEEEQEASSASLCIRNLVPTLKLPTTIRHKGRPRGLGKTTNYYQRKIKGKSQISCPSAKKEHQLLVRTNNSKEISSKDVYKKNPGLWEVKSQSNPNSVYSINVHQNTYSCSCPDRFRPCKHILKIQDMIANEMSGGIRFIFAIIMNGVNIL